MVPQDEDILGSNSYSTDVTAISQRHHWSLRYYDFCCHTVNNLLVTLQVTDYPRGSKIWP